MILILLIGRSGVVFAVKLYPAGATTNSQDGVTDLFGRCLPVLEEMVVQNMPLLVFPLPQKLICFFLFLLVCTCLWSCSFVGMSFNSVFFFFLTEDMKRNFSKIVSCYSHMEEMSGKFFIYFLD